LLEGYDAADDVLRFDDTVVCHKPPPPRELLLEKFESGCVGECPPRALVGMVERKERGGRRTASDAKLEFGWSVRWRRKNVGLDQRKSR
jgi:hypothetical protein